MTKALKNVYYYKGLNSFETFLDLERTLKVLKSFWTKNCFIISTIIFILRAISGAGYTGKILRLASSTSSY